MNAAQPKEPGQAPAPPPAGAPPESPRRPRFSFSRWWVLFALSLFALNYWAGSRANEGPSRVRVPYSPFFVQQVQAGNVTQITSKGTAIQGAFRTAQRYGKAKPTRLFKTEIPSFADTDVLSQLLERKRVVVNAKPLDKGRPGGRTCCSASARRSSSWSCCSG